MSRFRRRTPLPFPPEEVFAWHERAGALRRLIPPWESVRLRERTGTIRSGDRTVLEVRVGPFPVTWVARHRDYAEGRRFADEQLEGPFRRWVHTHRFLPAEGGGSVLEDDIAYRLPGAPVSGVLLGGAVQRRLARTFRWRHERTRLDLWRHRLGAGRGSLRVAVTGASGLVGSALSAFLSAGGHRVHPVVRRRPREGSDEVYWKPSEGRIDAEALEGVDAVVHLAGENLFGFRWSREKRRRILESRAEGTRLLAGALAGLRRPPEVLVSASGVNFYGDRGDETLDEESASGEGFLATVAREWEGATAPAGEAGIRVVRLRFGVVQSAAGGALAMQLLPFRLGLGATLGDGRQWGSWISLEDLVGVIHHAMLDEGLSGPVNATAPEPVRNEEQTRALARVLRRPAPFRIPASVLRGVMGEMAEETLLVSLRVLPRKLEARGFGFLHPEIEDAFRWELGRGWERHDLG